MNVTVKVDVRKDLARIKAAAGPEYKNVLREFMRKSGRALISSSGKVPGIVQVTAPHSQGKKGSAAKKQGEAAVSVDINRVYGSPGKLYALIRDRDTGAAAGFWKLVKAKDWSAANAIAERLTGKRLREFDDGSAHDARRNNRGRVSGRDPSIYIAQLGGRDGKAPGPWVSKYIKEKQKRVGLLSAAVVNSATSKFGPLSGVPEWVKRHTNASGGRCLLDEKANGFVISVENLSRRGQKDLQRKFDYVAGYRFNAMKRELPFVARALEKKLQTALAAP